MTEFYEDFVSGNPNLGEHGTGSNVYSSHWDIYTEYPDKADTVAESFNEGFSTFSYLGEAGMREQVRAMTGEEIPQNLPEGTPYTQPDALTETESHHLVYNPRSIPPPISDRPRPVEQHVSDNIITESCARPSVLVTRPSLRFKTRPNS